MTPGHKGLTVMSVHGGPRWTGSVRLLPERLEQPLRWKKPRTVFVNSMSDLFHKDVPLEFVAAVFGVMAATPQHIYIVLTKRPQRALEFFEWSAIGAFDRVVCYADDALQGAQAAKRLCWAGRGGRPSMWPLSNVILGVSVEDQATADERIPLLLGSIPAATRMVSYEPALGPIDFTQLRWGNGDFCNALKRDSYRGGLDSDRIDWLVVGGESGPGARVFDVAWARATIHQCREAGVPCFVKQLGSKPFVVPFRDVICKDSTGCDADPDDEQLVLADRKGGDPSEWPPDLRVREFPEVAT